MILHSRFQVLTYLDLEGCLNTAEKFEFANGLQRLTAQEWLLQLYPAVFSPQQTSGLSNHVQFLLRDLTGIHRPIGKGAEAAIGVEEDLDRAGDISAGRALCRSQTLEIRRVVVRGSITPSPISLSAGKSASTSMLPAPLVAYSTRIDQPPCQ